MFKEASPQFNFPDLEDGIKKFWKEKKIFEKSMTFREGKEEFVFYEGPPTANGLPHPGHVLTRVVKDLFPRYKTMCGYHVNRKAGWDTHGLPVEIEVEKVLELDSKNDIEEYGIEPFIKKCKESVWKYKGAWEELTENLGFWIDLDEPYVTYETEYIESVWWAIQQIHKKGLLYQGHKILPWCPRCGTGLSSHEVGLGYETTQDPSVYVAFPVKGEENLYFAAWTTTPWTLLSNVALTVGEEFDYAYIKIPDGDEVIMAEKLLDQVFDPEEVEVTKTVKGKELLGMEYEPLFDYARDQLAEQPNKKAYQVVSADFVSLDSGTGIVHTAPAFGEDDYEVGRANDLALIKLVDERGEFIDAVEPWKGTFVKDADTPIIRALRDKRLLLKSGSYEHEYPFCWRCDTHLLYMAQPSWFIETTKVIDRIIELNGGINWAPDHIKSGRFGKFLENNKDWALSRERYWGTPLPIWQCAESGCDHMVVMGSVSELTSQSGYDGDSQVEPHKPYIDEVTFDCEKCSGTMKRVPEVIDCWFDSGSMPFAQWGYPHKNKEKFERYFPANFISEALDQTRGWFYTLLMINGILFDKSPYDNCLVLGLILGEDGTKMSKRLGNYVEPSQIFENEGADAMRWFFYSQAPSWSSIRFFEDGIKEAQKDFLIKIWNCYSFFTIYANLDGYDPNKKDMKVPPGERTVLDRWILAEFQKTTKEVRNNLDEYHIHGASQSLIAFVDSLSNWYIRRSRDRFWSPSKDRDKWAAYSTLYETLTGLIRLIAPFVPFITEEMYQNLEVDVKDGAQESVHLCHYPEVDENLYDEELIEKMSVLREIVTLGHNARSQEQIKVRQPLPKVMAVLAKEDLVEEVEPLADLIKDELNVKEVEFVAKADEYVGYVLKPNFKLVGPKYGSLAPKIKKKLSEIDATAAKNALEDKGKLEINVDGKEISLLPEEVIIELYAQEGYTAADGRQAVVILDIRLTDELIEEGLAREIVSRIQKERKDLDLAYDDTIKVEIYPEGKLEKAVENFSNYIKEETLTQEMIVSQSSLPKGKKDEIDGDEIEINVEPLS